ncbi:MAG: gamma-glutamyltransferase [Hyphomicrobiaceae bacterium]
MRNFHFPGRSPVYARHAMVATSHPLASLTAIDILKKGGNAVDATVATAALLAVAEPQMTGIGGDCFAILSKPGQKGLIALNASGRAPAAATTDWYAKAGIRAIAKQSPHAVTVPGAVEGWLRLLADHGTMTPAEVLEPAIALAEEGFVVAPRVAHDWGNTADLIRANAGASKHLLAGGKPPRVGDVWRFPALAATLKAIARHGRDGFYRGEVAADMVGTLRDMGGLHTLDDFAAQDATYVTPISTRYGPYDVCQLPPNNHGITALVLLNMLSKLGRIDPDPTGTTRYHVLMEAARLAYAARDAFVADPDMADVPVEHMLSPAFTDALVSRIDPKRKVPDLGPVPRPSGSDTVCFSIVDGNGMVVSFINSVFATFGAVIATEKTGVVFHNRAQGFMLDPAHPNAIAPRKRPLHTLIPAIALQDGEPALSFGVMGAAFQPMGHVYLVSNLVDYGLDVQEAVDLPRVFFEGGDLSLEESVPAGTESGLRALGHSTVRRPDPWGGAQAILIDRGKGILVGASDPRKDGMAIGY